MVDGNWMVDPDREEVGKAAKVLEICSGEKSRNIYHLSMVNQMEDKELEEGLSLGISANRAISSKFLSSL